MTGGLIDVQGGTLRNDYGASSLGEQQVIPQRRQRSHGGYLGWWGNYGRRSDRKRYSAALQLRQHGSDPHGWRQQWLRHLQRHTDRSEWRRTVAATINWRSSKPAPARRRSPARTRTPARPPSARGRCNWKRHDRQRRLPRYQRRHRQRHLGLRPVRQPDRRLRHQRHGRRDGSGVRRPDPKPSQHLQRRHDAQRQWPDDHQKRRRDDVRHDGRRRRGDDHRRQHGGPGHRHGDDQRRRL